MALDRAVTDRRSRRAFLEIAGAGLAGASAAVLGACGDAGGGGDAGADPEAEFRDVEILNRALDLENMAVAAYTAGSALLSGPTLEGARRILEQEREHAQALSRTIRGLGVEPNRAKAPSAYNFPTPKGPQDVVKFAARLESSVIAAYIEAIPRLSDPKLRQTSAAIATDEAEHLTFLLQRQGKGPGFPAAFVTGEKQAR